MRSRKALSFTAALALAAFLFVPDATFARGGGGVAARGPVFGLHGRAAVHRPFRPALAHRAALRFGWQLRWWNRFGRHRAGTGAFYPAYDAGVTAPYPADVTGTVPGPGVFLPPYVPPAPSERVGCLAHGYDVPAEVGGIAKVVVIRC
jgi:hypothetical protein